MERLRITIEFNKNRKEELNLYEKLQNYSNPAAYIKDVLRGYQYQERLKLYQR